jgi:hypothetical protein
MNYAGHSPTDQLQAAQKAYEELNWRLAFLRGVSNEPTPKDESLLKWYQDRQAYLYKPEHVAGMFSRVQSPNTWFNEKFPSHVAQFGPAFLELRESSINGDSRITPVSLNCDVFAAALSDSRLGLSIVYYLPDLEWYYLEPQENIYNLTTPERMQLLFRGIMMKCFEHISNPGCQYALFHQFRDDATSKAVVNRAKSILSVGESFFAPDSLNIRKQGPEWPERVARVLIESMLERKEGAVLTLTRAYNLFSALSIQRDLQPVRKATFKHVMRDLMKQEFGVCLRNDVPDENNKQQTGWKGVSPVNAEGQVAG